jgi:hypothetical protein
MIRLPSGIGLLSRANTFPKDAPFAGSSSTSIIATSSDSRNQALAIAPIVQDPLRVGTTTYGLVSLRSFQSGGFGKNSGRAVAWKS